jgi:hypothetical protein
MNAKTWPREHQEEVVVCNDIGTVTEEKSSVLYCPVLHCITYPTSLPARCSEELTLHNKEHKHERCREQTDVAVEA